MERPLEPAQPSRQPKYLRIAEGLRDQISGGTFTPREQLPSIDQLVSIWDSSYGTVQSAITTLVKEGWVERRQGAGTYAVDPAKRFVCAGIYHCVDITSPEQQSPFGRNLHFSLLVELERLGKAVQVFIDSRPKAELGTLAPSLAEAMHHRHIHCLVATTIDAMNDEMLARLPIPTAFLANRFSSHNFSFDDYSLLSDGIRHLAQKGCRSVGLISSIGPDLISSPVYGNYYDHFRRTMRKEGLIMREDWIRMPHRPIYDLEDYGYLEFHKLRRMPETPEGVIVFPDVAARGVVLAVLEAGVQSIGEKMKFVFHRNAHFKVLCPFPATWAITREDTLARGLIRMIQDQFDGKKIEPVHQPYEFEEYAALPLD